MRAGDFSKVTKRAALKRSGGKCEATGALYGLEPSQRCSTPLSYGVEFDHINLVANSKDNSLKNCGAVCPKCHRYKTDHHDTPCAAKTQRQQDKNGGIRNRKGKGKPFPGSRDSGFKVRMTSTGKKVERRWG